MSPLFSLTSYQSEALVFCLAASLVWAPLVFLATRLIDENRRMRGEGLWIGALIIAVLPALAAPTLAAFGLSLRPAPAPLELMATAAVDFDMSPIATPTPAESAVATMLTPDQIVSAAGLLYIYGALLAFVLILARMAAFSFCAARATPIEDEAFLAKVEDWRARFGLDRLPHIRRSRHASSACVYGFVRPVILLPAELGERVSERDMVMMCAHELAHVARGDVRLFSASAVARALFWFNPFVARIAARVELAAEEGADALVLARGADRRAYAACFVEGLKFAAEKAAQRPVTALAFTPIDRMGRRRRLDSILTDSEGRPMSMKARLALGGATVIATLAALGQAALAVDPASVENRPALFAKLPVDGKIAFAFDEKSEVLPADRPHHEGLDIKAPKGAPVTAPADGVVIAATDRFNNSSAWGKVVAIDHGDGLVTRYAHLDEILVAPGQQVKTGQKIAKVGSTGKSTGPHLHFEVLQDGVHVDPESRLEKQTLRAPLAPPRYASAGGMNRIAPAAQVAAGPVAIDGAIAAPAPAIALARAEPAHAQDVAPVVAAAPSLMNEMVFAELEDSLLGGADNGVSYRLSFTEDGKTFTLNSGEPLTDEQKKALKKALKQMRKERAKAGEERAKAMAKHSEAIASSLAAHTEAMAEFGDDFGAEWSAQFAGEWAAQLGDAVSQEWEAIGEEFGTEFGQKFAMTFNGEGSGFDWSDEDRAAMREEMREAAREAREAQREAFEDRREALADARRDLRHAERDHAREIEDARRDLEDSRVDIEDSDLDARDRERAIRQIERAKASLERSDANERRSLADALNKIEQQEKELERLRKELDRVRSE